jgi:hypothetical protein
MRSAPVISSCRPYGDPGRGAFQRSPRMLRGVAAGFVIVATVIQYVVGLAKRLTA